MAKVDRLLKRGIALAQEGSFVTSRSLFRAVIADEPENQLAWGWYVQTFRDEEERIRAFDEYLHVFPQDLAAQKLQASLLKQQHQRWKLAANDAKREIALEGKNRKQAAKRSRLTVTAISVVLICILCFVSFVSARSIDTLSKKVSRLDHEYSVLENAYGALNTNYETLTARHNALIVEHNSLVDRHNELQTQYSILWGKYDWLEKVAVTPPYILTNGRNVHLAFNKLDGTIIYWDVPFSSLEHNLERGNLLRDRIDSGFDDYILYLRNTNTNESFYVPDYRHFIDPSPFVNVISDLYDQSSDSDAFLQEIWHIVSQLTTYSADITDTPRYPMETLLAGGGDCEDTAILFASMVLAAPVDWKVQLVYLDGNNPTHPLTMNHVSVFVVTNDRAYDVETTSKYEIDPYPDGVIGWYFDVE